MTAANNIQAEERVTCHANTAHRLLIAAERHFRLCHTDQAIKLLTQAESQLASAQKALPTITSEEHFSAQQRIDKLKEKMDEFRTRM